jgi:hypothetical protein
VGVVVGDDGDGEGDGELAVDAAARSINRAKSLTASAICAAVKAPVSS